MPPRSENINALLLRLQALGGTAHCQAVVDAVPQLVTCIKSGNAAAVRQAAFLLCNLPVTGGCTACSALVQAGAVPVMLRALHHSQDDIVLEAAAGMLNNLQQHGSADHVGAAAAAAYEARPQLLRLMRSGSKESQAAAGCAFTSLLLRPSIETRLLKHFPPCPAVSPYREFCTLECHRLVRRPLFRHLRSSSGGPLQPPPLLRHPLSPSSSLQPTRPLRLLQRL